MCLQERLGTDSTIMSVLAMLFSDPRVRTNGIVGIAKGMEGLLLHFTSRPCAKLLDSSCTWEVIVKQPGTISSKLSLSLCLPDSPNR